MTSESERGKQCIQFTFMTNKDNTDGIFHSSMVTLEIQGL